MEVVPQHTHYCALQVAGLSTAGGRFRFRASAHCKHRLAVSNTPDWALIISYIYESNCVLIFFHLKSPYATCSHVLFPSCMTFVCTKTRHSFLHGQFPTCLWPLFIKKVSLRCSFIYSDWLPCIVNCAPLENNS